MKRTKTAMWMGLCGLVLLAMAVNGAQGEPIKVFILAGQSNATGYQCDAGDLPASLQNPQSDVWFVDAYYSANPTTWISLEPQPRLPKGVDNHFDPSISTGHGPEITLGRDLKDYYGAGTDIAILKLAINGSGLYPLGSYDDWNINSTDEYYALLAATVPTLLSNLSTQSGQAVQVAGMFWVQGEEDTLYDNRGLVYEDNLSDFMTAVRGQAWAPSNMPWIMQRIHDDVAMASGQTLARDAVRSAQMNLADGDPYAAWVNTDDLSLSSDGLHFDSAGSQVLGNRLADAYVNLPEPGCMTLILLGAGGLLVKQRRRRPSGSAGAKTSP